MNTEQHDIKTNIEIGEQIFEAVPQPFHYNAPAFQFLSLQSINHHLVIKI